MLFGHMGTFAIEIGEVNNIQGSIYCQFRFWINGTAVGDWEDRIPLLASVLYTREFCGYSKQRIDLRFQLMEAQDIVKEVYDNYFAADYKTCDPEIGRQRDIFHLDPVGMGAIIDKYGIVLVSASFTESRLVVKDWIHKGAIFECRLPFGVVEQAGMEYVDWGIETLAGEIVSR
jgi:hypothetical protein